MYAMDANLAVSTFNSDDTQDFFSLLSRSIEWQLPFFIL